MGRYRNLEKGEARQGDLVRLQRQICYGAVTETIIRDIRVAGYTEDGRILDTDQTAWETKGFYMTLAERPAKYPQKGKIKLALVGEVVKIGFDENKNLVYKICLNRDGMKDNRIVSEDLNFLSSRNIQIDITEQDLKVLTAQA